MKKLILLTIALIASINVSASSFKAACLSTASSKGMRSDHIARVCKLANKHTAVCVNTAKNKGMRDDHVVNTCKNSSIESAVCIITARNKGMRGDHVAELCGNNTRDLDQSPISNTRLRLTLIDILSNIESNPERAKVQVENILLELELD